MDLLAIPATIIYVVVLLVLTALAQPVKWWRRLRKRGRECID